MLLLRTMNHPLSAFAASLLLFLQLLPTSVQAVEAPLQLDIEAIHELFNQNNPDVSRAMLNLYRAKQQVNLGRAGLTPSINLNVLASIANPPAFMINSVSCLVPFLFPTRWFTLRSDKKNYRAQVSAVHITKLNSFANIYSLALQIEANEKMLQIYHEQKTELRRYKEQLEILASIDVINPEELDRINLEYAQMEATHARNIIQMTEQKAAFRSLLGIELDQDFRISLEAITPSPLEGRPISNDTLDVIATRAPERRQLELLETAARAGIRATQWSFLAGCSGAQGGASSTAGSAGSAFQNTTAISISFGWGNFPQVALSRANLREVQLRQTELPRELGRNLEVTLTAISSSKQVLESATLSLSLASRIQEEQGALFQLGRATVKDLLDALNATLSAKLNLLSAQTELSGHRITLKRLMLEEKFLDVLVDSRRELEID